MKRVFLLIVFILLVFTGCNNNNTLNEQNLSNNHKNDSEDTIDQVSTNLKNNEADNKSKFDVKKEIPVPVFKDISFIYAKDEISVDELVESTYPIVIYIDGIELNDDYISLSEGKYTVTCIANDGEYESDKVYLELVVLEAPVESVVKNVANQSRTGQTEFEDKNASFSKFDTELNINPIYREGVEIPIRNLIKTNYDFRIYLDDVEISTESITPERGNYRLKVFVYDESWNGSEYVQNLLIMPKDDLAFIDVVYNIDASGYDVKTHFKSEVSKPLYPVYVHDTNHVSKWFYVEVHNSIGGYIPYDDKLIPEDKTLRIHQSKHSSGSVTKEEELVLFKEFNDNGYKTYKTEKELLILEPMRNTFASFGFPDRLYFNQDKTAFFYDVNYDRNSHMDNQYLISLAKDDFVFIQLHDYEIVKTKEFKWLNNNEFTFKQIISPGLDYHSLTDTVEISGHVSLAPEPIVTIDDSKLVEYKENYMKQEEKISLYYSDTRYADAVDMISNLDDYPVSFRKYFGYFEDELVLWFSAKTENWRSRYANRTRRQDEFIYYDEVSLILKSGHSFKIKEPCLVLNYAFDEECYIVVTQSGHKAYSIKTGFEVMNPYLVINKNLVAKFNDAGGLDLYLIYNDEKALFATIGNSINSISNYELHESSLTVSFNNNSINEDFLIHSLESKTLVNDYVSYHQVQGRVDVPSLNVRKGPSMDDSIVGEVNQGNVFKVVGFAIDKYKDVWLKIDDEQWIAGRYCILD